MGTVLVRRLFSRCKGLLEVQSSPPNSKSKNAKVQFLHLSVKDFFAIPKTFESLRQRVASKTLTNVHVFMTEFLVADMVHRDFSLWDHCEVFYHARMVEETTGLSPVHALDALEAFVDGHNLTWDFMGQPRLELPTSLKTHFLTLAAQAGLVIFVERSLSGSRPYKQLDIWALLYFAILPFPNHYCEDSTDPWVLSPQMIRLLVSYIDLTQDTGRLTLFGYAFSHYYWHSDIDLSFPTWKLLEILKCLLEGGSNPNVEIFEVDRMLQTPAVIGSRRAYGKALDLAVSGGTHRLGGNQELAKLLLDHGADTKHISVQRWEFMKTRDKVMYHMVMQYHHKEGGKTARRRQNRWAREIQSLAE